MATYSSSSPKPFDFSSDSPPKPSLSSDQLKYCSQALTALKPKIQNPSMIQQEFIQLQNSRIKDIDMIKSCRVAVRDGNRSKNRYETEILPFDKTRVVLKDHKGRRESDFINANFLKIDGGSEFIATQGPMPNTYEDFWEMVIQYHCPVIVMLTEASEGKCGDYFQIGDGKVCVSTKWKRNTDPSSLVLRCLEVKYKDSDEPGQSVIHVQYPKWPDHGVPKDTLAVREILRMIYHVPPSLGPIVVHCSAGIGRTGAFCTIVNTIQRILAGDLSALDLVTTVSSFRSQRLRMVETMVQYQFSYDAIVDELEHFTADASH